MSSEPLTTQRRPPATAKAATMQNLWFTCPVYVFRHLNIIYICICIYSMNI